MTSSVQMRADAEQQLAKEKEKEQTQQQQQQQPTPTSQQPAAQQQQPQQSQQQQQPSQQQQRGISSSKSDQNITSSATPTQTTNTTTNTTGNTSDQLVSQIRTTILGQQSTDYCKITVIGVKRMMSDTLFDSKNPGYNNRISARIIRMERFEILIYSCVAIIKLYIN